MSEYLVTMPTGNQGQDRACIITADRYEFSSNESIVHFLLGDDRVASFPFFQVSSIVKQETFDGS